jgi:hypothetical protein
MISSPTAVWLSAAVAAAVYRYAPGPRSIEERNLASPDSALPRYKSALAVHVKDRRELARLFGLVDGRLQHLAVDL